MKFTFTTLFLAFLGICVAAESRKQTIFTYPNNTPANIMNEAMDAIRKEGGVITHQFQSINSFVAQVKDETIAQIHALSSEFSPIVEDDGIMTINEDGPQ